MLRLTCLLAAAVSACGLAADAPQGRFVVHEWGVHVRTQTNVKYQLYAVRGPEQITVPQFVLNPLQSYVDDLPPFVLRHDKEFSPRLEARDWNKPVLHFYGRPGLDVTVQVRTPQGRPTAYWPRPELTRETFWWMGRGITDATGLTWKGRLAAEVKPETLREVKDGHWWKTLRAVPGLYFQNDEAAERFIFYEANAVKEPPLSGRIAPEGLVLHNTGPVLEQVLVIVNDEGERRMTSFGRLPARNDLTVSRDDLLRTDPVPEKVLCDAARAQWRAFGLTAEEADAVVQTWLPCYVGRSGILVISRMPAADYDQMFPLTITPRPDELVRAGVVFDTLPGDPGRLDWLPALKKTVEQALADLKVGDPDARAAASAKLVKLGDVVEPALRAVLKEYETEERKDQDPEYQGAIRGVLAQLAIGTLTMPTPNRGPKAKVEER